MFWLLALLAYLLGSLSFAIVLSRLSGSPDPRICGSGNAGATNMLRLAGRKLAILTLLGDLCKGLLPVLIASLVGLILAFVGASFPRRKLLLVGPPGTGKTMTAAALAGELGIPLFLVRLDSLITKFMGETATKLRQVFDAVSDIRGVYFFDELLIARIHILFKLKKVIDIILKYEK